MFSDYIKVMRPKHYLKNLLIFLPLVFSGNFFDRDLLRASFGAFIIFSLVASAVYILNDIRDKDVDMLHNKKKYRPISSGAISVRSASILAVSLGLIALAFQYISNRSLISFALLLGYLLMNVMYSFGLKNIPIIDVTILALGFMLRVFYGADAIGVAVSNWLYLAVLTFSYYLGLGKRRNEFRKNGHTTRKVNKYYNQEFLDKNMYLSLCLTIVFYSLWTVDPVQTHKLLVWTVPLVMAISMTYSLSVEQNDSDGDPINVLTGNKPLILLVGLYGMLMVGIIYVS